jgi:hypothetical protein
MANKVSKEDVPSLDAANPRGAFLLGLEHSVTSSNQIKTYQIVIFHKL